MGKSLRFSYLYGNEGEKYQFYRIPKTLIVNDYFSGLSLEAKLLYSFMLDRAHLSARNKDAWEETDGRIYIIYSAETIMKDLSCASAKAAKIKKELTDIGLIEIKKQGLGKPDKIYVMNFESVLDNFPKSNPRRFQNRTLIILRRIRLRIIKLRIIKLSHHPMMRFIFMT